MVASAIEKIATLRTAAGNKPTPTRRFVVALSTAVAAETPAY
jgi:hypothetical protein